MFGAGVEKVPLIGRGWCRAERPRAVFAIWEVKDREFKFDSFKWIQE